ncbi:MAG: hypothetical protein ACXADO_00635 [Candidatus Thorarchaeota archaeon]
MVMKERYTDFTFNQSWTCMDCDASSNMQGHPQAKAHRRKTGHRVIVHQHFEYHYYDED